MRHGGVNSKELFIFTVIPFEKDLAGFVHLFKAKLQRLFKDFPVPYFQNSRTFLHTNLPPTKEMFVLLINTCTCRESLKTRASTSGSMDMHEGKKSYHWEQKTSIFTHFVSI